jgi:hypothetical protein
MSARKKPARKKLKVEKRRFEEQPEDLLVDEDEADDIKGGFAPPYVPVMPSRQDQLSRPNLPGPGELGQSGPTRGG